MAKLGDSQQSKNLHHNHLDHYHHHHHGRRSSIKHFPTRHKMHNLIRESMLSSTSHGIPNILRAKYRIVKALWAFFFLVSSSICCFLVYKSVIEYLSYEVVTKIRYIKETTVDFPTITICNKNPFVTNHSVEFLIRLFKELKEEDMSAESLG